jgi:ribosomal-protein-alanine N-acetyltransferase
MTASPCGLIALTPAMAAIAAMLHGAAGFPDPWREDAFAELLAMPGVAGLLATIGGDEEAAGLILWRVAADEGEILTFCVAPDRRRHGIGRGLLAAAATRMREDGVRRLFLEAAIDNAPAVALYDRAGFSPAGRRRGYYRTKDGAIDAVILTCELGTS